MQAQIRDGKAQASADQESEDSCKHVPEKGRLKQARTRRAKIQESTDLKSKGPHNHRPAGQRSAQFLTGWIKVWARENQSATKVSRSTVKSNRGGQVESRGLLEANKEE